MRKSSSRLKTRASAVCVQLLGAPRWSSDLGESGLFIRKDAALLAQLALRGPQAREPLARLLWPDGGEAKATTNLRARIAKMRRETGHRLVETGPVLQLAEGVTVDAVTIAALTADELRESGDLLSGHEFTGKGTLDALLRADRERCRRAVTQALKAHVAELEAGGRLAAALALNALVLDREPFLEHAWRRQMQLHYLRGDPAAALDAFERLEELLKERGTKPGEETCELQRTIEFARQPSPFVHAAIPLTLKRPPAVIGRAREWNAMLDAWDAGRPFVLVAEAGMGKTRLLKDHADRSPGSVCEAARLGDHETPYAVMGRLLQAVLERCTPALAEASRPELARIVPGLGPAPSSPTWQPLLWSAIEALLANALERGLASLVVDDLHQADLATLEALRWLASSSRLADLRFGLASRPPDDNAIDACLCTWFEASQGASRILLEPLSRDDIAGLLECVALPDRAPLSMADQLFRHAGGNPFLTLETLKEVVCDGGREANAPLPLPASAHVLLERRLRALPPEAVDLMRVAAVCGVDLTVERAAELLGKTAVGLASAWKVLEARNVLHELRFSHDLVHQSALQITPRAVAAVLHSRLARMLALDADVPAARIASHWQAAEAWAEAAAAWQAAAARARSAARMDEHGLLMRRAADCHHEAGNPGGEFDALYAMVDSRFVTVGPNAVLAELPRLEALATTPERRVQALLVRVNAMVMMGRVEDSLQLSAEAVSLARGFPRLVADALGLYGTVLAQAGHRAEAMEVQREAVAHAQASGDTAQRMRATASLAYALALQERYGDAVPVQRESMRLAAEMNDTAEVAMTEANLAIYLAESGDLRSAGHHASQARDRYALVGSMEETTHGSLNLLNLGSLAACFGRFDEALEALDEAVRILGRGSHAAGIAKARITLARTWLTLGDPGRARDALDVMPPGAPSMWHALRHLTLARAVKEGGDPEAHALRLAAGLIAENPSLEGFPSLWHEWFRHAEPATVIAKLGELRSRCEKLGLHGTPRMLAVFALSRQLETIGPGEAAPLAERADSLVHYVEDGLHVGIYPPFAWLTLAKVYERAGQSGAARKCRSNAVDWIRNRALPHVPTGSRSAFLERNPVNRELLEGGVGAPR